VSAETIKYAMRSLLNPLAQLLVAMEISPGVITAAGLVLSALAALLFGLGAFIGAGIVLIISGLADMLDGMVARSSGKAGTLGAVVDSVSDRYADALVLFGVFFYYAFGGGTAGAGEGAGAETRPAVAAYLALAAIVGSFMVSYVRARAEGLGLECKIGLLERPWRMVILIVGAFFGSGVMTVLLWPLAVLTHFTAMQRVLEVKKQVALRGGGAKGSGSASAGNTGGDATGAATGAATAGREASLSGGGSEPTAEGGSRAWTMVEDEPRPESKKHGGLFVTLEGIEGSGKSTQLSLVADKLKEEGLDVVVTREPGGTSVGESIRELLLESEDASISPEAELLLYLASRAQHVREVIAPALASGAVVLCDRYSDATVAYQAGGRGLSRDSIREMNEMGTGGLKPDLTILLDLPEDEGLARAGGRGRGPDRMEREEEGFHRDVRRAYLDIAEKEPDRVRIIDATGRPEEISEMIVSVIQEARV
jgi:dTMP kinase